jgi:hypothetical protein
VRILLDSFFDSRAEAQSNYETCVHFNQFAPLLDVECRLGNPTGRGIHNKLVLVRAGASAWVHLGSINGSETSSKLNRELAVQHESVAAYQYWRAVFDYDWSSSPRSPHRQFVPLFWRRTTP